MSKGLKTAALFSSLSMAVVYVLFATGAVSSTKSRNQRLMVSSKFGPVGDDLVRQAHQKESEQRRDELYRLEARETILRSQHLKESPSQFVRWIGTSKSAPVGQTLVDAYVMLRDDTEEPAFGVMEEHRWDPSLWDKIATEGFASPGTVAHHLPGEMILDRAVFPERLPVLVYPLEETMGSDAPEALRMLPGELRLANLNFNMSVREQSAAPFAREIKLILRIHDQ